MKSSTQERGQRDAGSDGADFQPCAALCGNGVVCGSGHEDSHLLAGGKKLDWGRFFGSGGMPSSHTAFVVSLALAVGAAEGFGSTTFALSFTLAAIVMYDATGVRRETGIQAQVINEILRRVFVNGEPIADDDLKELVGHKPLEVLGGAVLGALTAGAFMLL